MKSLATLPAVPQMILAAIIAGGLVALAGPRAALLLGRWGQRQRIREDAPGRHREKAGTPTMGGVLIVGAILVSALLVGGASPRVVFALTATVAFGMIGFLDDVLAIRRGRNLGLRARERLALQTAAGLLIGWYAAGQSWLPTTVLVPGLQAIDLGRGYAVFAALLFVGFSNAVNLTDGLDGLAAGLVAMAAAGFALLGALALMPAVGVLAMAVSGAAAGFLRVNAHPARVFMGDVGSNALGAALASLAMLTKAEAALFVIGGVFLVEAASVLLQVAYFKATGGRRIFLMSPLHHHFELAGWSERTVVRRFYWAGWICLGLGLLVAT